MRAADWKRLSGVKRHRLTMERIAAGDVLALRRRLAHLHEGDEASLGRPIELNAGPGAFGRFAYGYGRLAEGDARRSAELDPKRLLTPDPDEAP